MDDKVWGGVIDCKIRSGRDEGKKEGVEVVKMRSISNKPVERMKVLVDRKVDI